VMLRLGIFGSWVALYELSSQDSSRRSLKRCERSQPVEPLGQILQASCSFPSTRLGPGHSLALDIKRVLTLGGRKGGEEGGEGSFQGLRLFVGGARKDGAQPGRRSGAPALSRALSLSGG
jgi:hypothetical protein